MKRGGVDVAAASDVSRHPKYFQRGLDIRVGGPVVRGEGRGRVGDHALERADAAAANLRHASRASHQRLTRAPLHLAKGGVPGGILSRRGNPGERAARAPLDDLLGGVLSA